MGKRNRTSRNKRNAVRSPSGATPTMLPDGGIPTRERLPDLSEDASYPAFGAFERAIKGTTPIWWRRPATYVGAAVLLVLMAWLLRPVLTTIGSAFAVAYFASPMVDRLEKRGVPRSASIAAIILGFFGMIAAIIAVLVPVLQSELEGVIANAPGYWEKGNVWFTETVRPYVKTRTGYELPTTTRDVWNEAVAGLGGVAPDLAGKITGVVKSALSNVFGLLGLLLNFLLFPVFLFYILKDFPRIRTAIKDVIPPRHLDVVQVKISEIDRVLSAFVRGQLTVCCFLAVGYSAGLILSGIDMPIVIGTVSGFAFVIPYAGTILGIVMASAMALAKFGIDWHLGVAIGTFVVIQFLESNVISPKIVGEQVGLHPMVMITAVIVGGTLFGFLGVLLAVPATAVAAVFWWSAWGKYKSSDFYLARR